MLAKLTIYFTKIRYVFSFCLFSLLVLTAVFVNSSQVFASLLALPFPPLEHRRLVGPLENIDFDNPSGNLIFSDIDPYYYDSVFDFGCGCGRQARQLMQQRVRPNRYVGIDINPEMISWCQLHLTPFDPNFEFFHHSLLTNFPVNNGEFSLVNVHSVFTHLYKEQSIFYLKEIERILKPDGMVRTTWFFFDRGSFPFLADFQVCLYVNEHDCTNAVVYDRTWFLQTIRQCGFVVIKTIVPGIPGGQWTVFLQKRKPNSIDNFPMGDEGTEWLCGAHVPKTLSEKSPDFAGD